MFAQFGSQLHYRCNFTLTPNEPSENDWADLVRSVRDWVSRRCGYQEALGKRWYFEAGEWRPATLPRFRVLTASCVGSGDEHRPEFWAIRYEHPCDDVPFRQWQTDIGLTLLPDGGFRFVLTNTHSLRPGFIGDEPYTPVPSAPGIVTSLLKSPRWIAQFAGESLSSEPQILEVGQGGDFVRRLEAPDRCPIILVALNFFTQRPMVNAAALARLLAGAAVVYESATSEVDKELEWLLPRHLRCWNGMVRVYQPGVRRDDEFDGGRHRWFTADQIDERTPQTIQEMIVRGIVRRGRYWTGNGVASIEDVHAKQREYRLAELRTQIDGKSSDEWYRLVDEENDALIGKVQELTAQRTKLEQEKDDLESQLGAKDFEIEALKDNLSKATAHRSSGATGDAELAQACRAAFDGGAPTLEQALALIARLYPERVVVLESAWKSARDAELFQEKGKAFKLILDFATKYWSLLDSGQGNAKAREIFGKAFAARESESVENNRRAKDLRTFEVDGEPVVMWGHLKIGVKESVAQCWRMHFHWNAEKKQLVVGHCGEHLDHD